MKKALIVILILFPLLISTWWVLLSPSVSKIHEVKEHLRQGREIIEKSERLWRQSEGIDQRVASFQTGIQHLAHYLPRPEEISSISNAIRSKGTEYGLKMRRVDSDWSFHLEGSDSSPDTPLRLETIPFTLQVEGQLADLCRYLEWLEELPYFFGIESGEMVRPAKGSLLLPPLRLNLVFHIMCLSRMRASSVHYIQKEAALYQPVSVSPSLAAAQKNLRITSLEKDIFSPGENPGIDEYVIVEGAWAGEAENEFWMEEKPAAGSLKGLNLNGIVSYQGEYIALINNQRVRKGDILAGMEVVWITKDSICMANGSEKVLLRLHK